MRKVLAFFDKMEDWVRGQLSHAPMVYALVGAVGIILLWKGVWEVAEYIPGLWGWGSILMGVIILLASGLLVSFFIGDTIIMSGLRHEKKVTEKTEKEVEAEVAQTQEILTKLEHIEHDINQLKKE